MKIFSKIVITLLCVFFLLTAMMFVGLNKMLKDTYEMLEKVETVDLNNVTDGVYIGTQETALVKVDVEVDIENHVIKNIRLLRHECGKGKKAEMIIDEIKEKNSTEVDDIAGATMSSRVIRAAANIALKKGDR